jgi:GAF domain-containing protein
VDLAEVQITSQLALRRGRAAGFNVDSYALTAIARAVGRSPEALFDTVVQLALELCAAGSAGISMIDAEDEESGFAWTALAGQLGARVGGRTPRHDSACGITYDTCKPQLFQQPARHFQWMSLFGVQVEELLVVPLLAHGRTPYGNLWAVHHEPGRNFDSEDLRILTSLASHASAARQL